MIANSKMPNSPYSATISKEEVYEQSTGLSTIITYIAIYIGLVFLITCAAVLALQQLSENADNIEKYQLLSKIGTSQKMINHAIKAQIIVYFGLPLSLALVHSYVGIKTAKILISTLGQINITQAAVAVIDHCDCYLYWIYDRNLSRKQEYAERKIEKEMTEDQNLSFLFLSY